jgi:sRNA-binding protein
MRLTRGDGKMNKSEADEYIKLLAEHYPKAFFETRQRRLPLKSDIDVDLKERGQLPIHF